MVTIFRQLIMFADKRFLMYWSLPVGLAFVLGVVWGRRKKSLPPPESEESAPKSYSTPNHSKTDSMPISSANGAVSGSATSPEGAGHQLGKSKPIEINSNRVTPGKLAIDILKVPGLPVKTPPSLDEDDDDECDKLTGSIGGRFTLNARTVKEGNPIVIKASKSPKISPEHSFVEAKYAEQQAEPLLQSAVPTQTTTPIDSSVKENNKNKTVCGKIARSSASPSSSLSSIHSKDSGKGSTPPRFDEPNTSYEFLVKQELVGTILGRKGAFVREIKKKCLANVLVKKHPTNEHLKVACIEGKQEQIDEALKMIRARLPIKRHPGLTMKRVFLGSNHGTGYFNPSELQLNVSLFF